MKTGILELKILFLLILSVRREVMMVAALDD